MIFINGEQHTLTMAEISAIRKKFPKFPIRLKYPKHKIKKSKLNPRPDQPASASCPLVAIVKTSGGTKEYRYADTRIEKEGGGIQWVPTTLAIQRSRTLQDTDMELIYWLMKACPYLEGGENHDPSKSSKFAFEDLLGVALLKAEKKAEEAEVNSLIYSNRIGLGEEKLRLVAKAYFLKGVDEMSIPQVRVAIEYEVHRNRDGVAKFLELIDAEQVLLVKSRIQSAIDNKIIIFNAPKKLWAWVTGEGSRNETIVKISTLENPTESIYNYYNGNPSFAELLIGELVSRNLIEEEDVDE